VFCSRCGTELTAESAFCSKCGNRVTSQSQTPATSPSANNLASSTPLKSAPQSRMSEMKKYIIRARKGEERLWKVFWLNIVLVSLLLRFLSPFVFSLLSAGNIYIEWKIFRFITMILLLVFVVLIIVYFIWALASMWKCAFNVDVKWKWMGYLARALVVWYVFSFFLVLLSPLWHS